MRMIEMRDVLRRGVRVLIQAGLNPRDMLRAVCGIPRFMLDLRKYSQLHHGDPSFPLRGRYLYPCLTDFTSHAGSTKGHYFHQDLYVARKIFARRPPQHFDIGSRIDGFVSHLLCFMEVECIDIRVFEDDVRGLTYRHADATSLTEIPSDSIGSISTLHAAEHFGLGRYGDPIEPAAYLRFIKALERVLAPGGRLYFSVPVGRERLEFNAHRIFAPATILNAFSRLNLVSFSAVLDDNRLYEDIEPERAASATYACGIFEFTK